MSAPFKADPAAVFASIAGSTAERDFPGLAAHVAAAMAAAPSTDYSAMVRAGIRQAAAAVPPSMSRSASVVQRHIEIKGPEFYGLRRVPDIEVIRDEVKKKRIPAGKSANPRFDACDASGINSAFEST